MIDDLMEGVIQRDEEKSRRQYYLERIDTRDLCDGRALMIMMMTKLKRLFHVSELHGGP